MAAPDASLQTLGTYRQKRDRMDSADPVSMALPHLIRRSDDGRLAAWDEESHSVVLWSARGAQKVRVSRIKGQVHKMRWLAGDVGVALTTETQLYLVGLPKTRLPRRVKAQAVFAQGQLQRIGGFRTVPGGVVITAAGGGESPAPFLTVAWHDASGKFTSETTVVLPDYADKMTTFGRHKIAAYMPRVPLMSGDPDGPSEPRIWIFDAATPNAAPRLEHERSAPSDLSTWSPGASKLTFLTADAAVVIGDRKWAASDNLALWQRPDFWLNVAEDRVVLADDARLEVRDADGTRLWAWTAPSGERIASVVFDVDNRSVLVASGLTIRRITDGKATVVLVETPRWVDRTAKKRTKNPRTWGRAPGPRSLVDGLVALPGGGVAYSLAHLKWREPKAADWQKL